MLQRLAFLIPILLLQGGPGLAQALPATADMDYPELTDATALVLARQVIRNAGNREINTYLRTQGGISGILDRAGYGGTDSDCDLLADTLVQLQPSLRRSFPAAGEPIGQDD